MTRRRPDKRKMALHLSTDVVGVQTEATVCPLLLYLRERQTQEAASGPTRAHPNNETRPKIQGDTDLTSARPNQVACKSLPLFPFVTAQT